MTLLLEIQPITEDDGFIQSALSSAACRRRPAPTLRRRRPYPLIDFWRRTRPVDIDGYEAV